MFQLLLCVLMIISNFQKIQIGFKRTILWNKHRSEITAQTKNNNLVCLIDINRYRLID